MILSTKTREFSHNSFFKELFKCPINRVQQLFHHLIDTFCGQTTSLYSSYSDIYTMLEWWDLIKYSFKFFKEILQQDNLISTNLKEFPTEYHDIVNEVLDVRASDLKIVLIERSHAVSPYYLKSFDWKLKLTVASDKMSHINEPRLLLDLDVSRGKLLQLDLNKNELKSLIDTMEKAKNVVTELQVD